MAVCVILGAGPGVSYSVAKAFLSRGNHVALCARNEKKLKELATEFGSPTSTWQVDVSNLPSLKKTLQDISTAHGDIEVLIFNAFNLSPGRGLELDIETFTDSMKVNIASALAATQAVIPSMLKNSRGSVLFTGGGFALQPYADLTALSVGKAGLRALARCLFEELTPKGVHVATVTICGTVQAGTQFDPDLIAKAFLRLHDQPIGSFEPEIIFTGNANEKPHSDSKPSDKSFPYKALVSFRFKVPITDEIKALIPAEKSRVAELQNQDFITQFYLAKDGQHGWAAVQDKDKASAFEQLQTLPLHDYLDFEFEELY